MAEPVATASGVLINNMNLLFACPSTVRYHQETNSMQTANHVDAIQMVLVYLRVGVREGAALVSSEERHDNKSSRTNISGRSAHPPV
jgi:hypothetical protein